MTAILALKQVITASDLIEIKMPRLNKCSSLEEYEEQLQNKENYRLERALITQRVILNVQEWAELTNNLLEDRDWLAGEGGSDTLAELREVDYFNQYSPLLVQ